MHRIPVRQIMQSAVITVRTEDLVADASQLMEEFTIRRLPVVDDDGCLIGIITDSDVREAESVDVQRSSYERGIAFEWLRVGDIMTRQVITIDLKATLGELAFKLRTHKIGGVPVVDLDNKCPNRQQLVGIVTESDIFGLIADAWAAENAPQADTPPTP
jgi:acetoin utilization protein AcuB